MSLTAVRLRLLAMVSSGALCIGALAGCGDDESSGSETTGAGGSQTTAADPTEPARDPGDETLEEILAEPDRYVGRDVIVTSGVDEADVAPVAFTLGEEGGSRQVLVIPTTSAQVPDDITERSVVRVQGEVATFDDTIGDRADFLFEDNTMPNFLRGFEDDPVIIASSVEVTGSGE